MVKPAIVEGRPITVEEVARLGNVSAKRTRELVEMARELMADQSRRSVRSKVTRKAAAKRAPSKTEKH